MRCIEGIDRKRKIAYPEYIDDYITDDNQVRVIDAFEVNSIKSLADKGYYNADDLKACEKVLRHSKI